MIYLDIDCNNIMEFKERFYIRYMTCFMGCWARTIVNETESEWRVVTAGLGQGRRESYIQSIVY